jgi:photosystem II stability/assembly factor-like uncharacterized protein
MGKAATILAVTLLVSGTASARTSPPAAASTAPVWSPAGASPEPSWRFTQTATTHRLVIADVVDRSVVWAVGGGETGQLNDGSVVRTTDGGRTWQNVTPPGGTAKDFMDVEAADSNHAIVLAVGPPSQIYRTTDGGATWHVVFEDANPDAFYDCVAFFDHRRGLAVSDPVGGRFRLAGTEDGGRSWHILKNVKMPPALNGEGAFATGTCLQAAWNRAWFGTATPAGVNARVFTTRDGGRSWTVATTPLPGGIRSISFRDPRHGVAVGGDPPPPTWGRPSGENLCLPHAISVVGTAPPDSVVAQHASPFAGGRPVSLATRPAWAERREASNLRSCSQSAHEGVRNRSKEPTPTDSRLSRMRCLTCADG